MKVVVVVQAQPGDAFTIDQPKSLSVAPYPSQPETHGVSKLGQKAPA